MARSTPLVSDKPYGEVDASAPLRFDAPADSAPTTAVSPAAGDAAYRAPRESVLRRLRAPLLLALVSSGLVAATWLAWSPVLVAVGEGATALAARERDGRTQESVTIALLTLAVLGFVVAWWRGSHPRRPVRLSGGRGRMAVDTIAGQLRDLVTELPEVLDAEVRVEQRGGGRLRVHAWLRVASDARIDRTLDAVDEIADWLVHHQLGLVLSEPALVDLRYDELDLRAGRARRADEQSMIE